jgi:hypothetical protein
MHDELSLRQQAIRMRLAGDPIPVICHVLHRCETWVHKWWRRYLALGSGGLYGLTRAMSRSSIERRLILNAPS